MALTGTETTLMSIDINDATKRTAAAVVTQHVEGDELLLVLSRLGYELRNPPVFDLGDGSTAKQCRNGHIQRAGNIAVNAKGMTYCVPCADDRARRKHEREQAARK